jgi:hypothetical protein
MTRIIDDYHKNPAAMHRAVIAALLPTDIRQDPAISRTGARNTVAVPPKILDAARGELKSILSHIFTAQSYELHIFDSTCNYLIFPSSPS